MKRVFLPIGLLLVSLSGSAQALKAPLMGWASWNNYNVNISESIIKRQADAMVSSGLLAAGYQFLNIDDGFFNGRYPDGGLRIDSIKFPHKMKYMADYIHSKGLKAGFYSDAGDNTCGSKYNGQTGGLGVGLYNHDQQDIDTVFMNWGFDFLKVDYCGGLTLKLDEKERYTAIRMAMDNTARTDINYNVCRWQFPGSWVTKVADSWRISADIYLSWNSVTSIIDKNAYLAAYCSQGHYNDMDMLEVGRGLTSEEDKSHFSMWCILSSPLVLGNDMSTISAATKTILTNAEVIAVNQDTTGLQAKIVTDNAKGLQVWAKALNGKLSKERAVVLLNRTAAPASMSVKWKDLNLIGPATARDLWTHTDLGTIDSMYTATVPSHGVVMLKVTGTQTKLPEVFEAEYGWINNFNLTANSSVLSSQGVAPADTVCSGRAKAGWLGNRADNYLEFRDVYANVAGNYTLKLTILSGEDRSATMTVNGKDTVLKKLNSGGWESPKTFTYPVTLKAGYNTIRFANSSAWVPDIDKVEIDLNRYGTTATIETPGMNAVSICPNPCFDKLKIDSKTPVKSVSIFSQAGVLALKTDKRTTIDISSLKAGVYLVRVATGSRVYNLKFVKQ
ncbi:MAG: T9SS type A sorting domain-containing protein [Bacteroidota bacterium]|nr:T9SS type A sorting domain-containing protein [Bacteroidota bacterium]